MNTPSTLRRLSLALALAGSATLGAGCESLDSAIDDARDDMKGAKAKVNDTVDDADTQLQDLQDSVDQQEASFEETQSDAEELIEDPLDEQDDE